MVSRREDRKQAVLRALAHHERTGAVHTYGTPIAPGEPWHVSLPYGGPRVELKNIGEVEAFCAGLAAGERHANRGER